MNTKEDLARNVSTANQIMKDLYSLAKPNSLKNNKTEKAAFEKKFNQTMTLCHAFLALAKKLSTIEAPNYAPITKNFDELLNNNKELREILKM